MIESYAFGRIVVDGTSYSNDIKIIDESVVPEWWRKRGHTVSPEDVSDLIDAQPEVVVIGKGKPGFMQTSPEVRKLLAERGIKLIEQKTSRAVQTYNRLQQEGKRVCAGFHLTC